MCNFQNVLFHLHWFYVSIMENGVCGNSIDSKFHYQNSLNITLIECITILSNILGRGMKADSKKTHKIAFISKILLLIILFVLPDCPQRSNIKLENTMRQTSIPPSSPKNISKGGSSDVQAAQQPTSSQSSQLSTLVSKPATLKSLRITLSRDCAQ